MYKIEFLLLGDGVDVAGYYVRDPEGKLHYAGPRYELAQQLIVTLICNPKEKKDHE